jgi:cellulose synthase/poly-beta-1,6-N-acetylglucosamine synthase-like glycosyltransferase
MNALVLAAVGLVVVTGLPYLAYVALYAWIRPEGSPADKRESAPTVSVVLPTYDEADIVERKLAELCALNYPDDRLEVVVVDDSDDDTADAVEAFFADRDAPSLTLIERAERSGTATAVNEGVAAASGEVVFRTDADSELDPGVLRHAVANLADPEVGAVTGQQAAVLGGSQVESDYRDILTRLQGLESHLDSTFIFHGPCGAFRRADFEPIDEDSLADDSEAALGIRRRGKRVILDPAMQFAEAGVSDFRERRQRKDRRAMGLVRLLVRNRDLLGRYGYYGGVVLPFNAWFMIASPLLVVLAALAVSAASVSLLGGPGLAVPLAIAVAFWLGQRDALGPLQPLHAVVDSQASLLIAQLRLLRGGVDGTWSVDRESREVFE